MGKSGLALGVEMKGTSDTIEALRGVKYGVGNRVLKPALRKQASKAARIARSLLGSSRTGLLKKAIGIVFRKPKRDNPGGGLYVVGPRRGFGMLIGAVEGRARKIWRKITGRKAPKKPRVAKRVVKSFGGLKVDPVKYAPLVEGGRGMVSPKWKRALSDGRNIYGRLVRAVKARPFMRPAAKAIETSGPSEIAADVKAGISREAAKYAAKGKSIYGG